MEKGWATAEPEGVEAVVRPSPRTGGQGSADGRASRTACPGSSTRGRGLSALGAQSCSWGMVEAEVSRTAPERGSQGRQQNRGVESRSELVEVAGKEQA